MSEMLTSTILNLHRQGFSPGQIASALDREPEAIEIMIRGQLLLEGSKSVTRFGTLKEKAYAALEQVLDLNVDCPGARVAAAKIVLDESNKGAKVTFDYDKLASIINAGRDRVLEVESSVEVQRSELRELSDKIA